MHRPIFGLTKLFVAGLVLVGALGRSTPAGADPASAAAVQRPFIVFDATLYKDKPSFAGHPGFRPITVIYEWPLFLNDQSPTAMPPEQRVRSIAKKFGESSESAVLDIERWPLKGDPQTVKTSVSKLLTVLSWIKAEAQNLKIGTYGTVPLPDYWRAIRGQGDKEYQAWQRDNDRLEELLPHMDALYPSIYTFYPDRKGWVTYAVAQIREARRKANGKPVYAFLWPQYHDQGQGVHAQLPIESDFWELQLNTMLTEADGIVIWGGWGEHGPDPWNEEAPWWQATKRLMNRIDSIPPDRPNSLRIR